MSLTTDPNDPALRETLPGGQNKTYLVLSEEELAKGFVCPVRRSYKHLACGGVTTMGKALCETYARNPKFYGATFCCICGAHFPLRGFKDGKWQDAFEWSEDGSPVGATTEEAEVYLANRAEWDALKRRAAERLAAAKRECDTAKDALFDLLRVEPVEGQAFADAQARCRKAIAEHAEAEKHTWECI